MLQPTRLISTPFAQEGEKTEIQNVTGEFDNSATYRLGFPPLTMQSIRSGGKPPKGTDFNGVLFDITENISFLCKGGRYQYNAGLSTLIGGYPKGSNLLLDDNVTEVVSTVAGNQNNPNTDMTGWILKPNKTTAEYVLDASGETQQQVNYNGGSKWHSRVGGYLENERVVLANGDIVKSTIDGNATDPNVNMTGWFLTNDSRQIKFKHTALFSVMRSLSDRLTDIASVKDFGAVGDGVTDDSAAINAAYESGAGIIIFPAGTYLIKSNVYPKSNTHTIAPKAKIIYHKEYANLTITDAHNVTIEGLTIDGNQFEWESWQGCGLNIFKSERITITGCEIYNAANSGINIGQVSTDPNEPINSKILIDNCYIHDIGTADINSFYAYGNGIAVVRGKDIVIRNNFIDKIYDIGGINLEGLLQDNIILDGNRITNLTGKAPAIKLWAGGIDDLADYVIIKNNIISNVFGGGGDWGAIHIKSAGNSLTIDNNKIYDCQSDGIVVTSAMDLTISNNSIKNSNNARLNINTASKAMNITGNYIGYAEGATAQPSWIETQGVTGSIANISNNTVENAPNAAFRLVFRNPS